MRYLLFILSLFIVVIATGCLPKREFTPKISYEIERSNIPELPGPFPTLSEQEKQQDWGKEYSLGIAFAHEFNLYQALTCFKRAQFLLSTNATDRQAQLSYDIILCYYLAKKYKEALETFDNSSLINVNASFPAYQDLIVILTDCFQKTNQSERADLLIQRLQSTNPQTAEHLRVSEALQSANWAQLNDLAQSPSPTGQSLKTFLKDYRCAEKSMSTAAVSNALLPGAGYWYVGQRDTAITALLINGLFIVASYEFFHHGYTAAGIITAGFECGWYFGGIYGGAEAAQYYNQRIYEAAATPYMEQQRLFPALLLQFGF